MAMIDRASRWFRLHPELVRMHQVGEPVVTPVRHVANAILEVGEDYVIVRSSGGSGKPRKILAQEINGGDVEWYPGRRRIIVALRQLADSLA